MLQHQRATVKKERADDLQEDYIMKSYKKESLIERLGGKANVIAMAIFAVIVLTVGEIWIEYEARQEEESQYIDSWEITQNRYIEWTWAGKGQGS